MKYHIKLTLYEFDIKTGKFKFNQNKDIDHDKDFMGASHAMFHLSFDPTNMNNKFFMIKIHVVDKNEVSFFTVRTNPIGLPKIEEITPNSFDQSILIDAIIGCEPTKEFIDSCNDRIIPKIIVSHINETPSYYTWSDDAKERLSKVNILRLNEIYKKIKS